MNLSTTFKCLAAAACAAVIVSMAACGDRSLSPSSPTPVSLPGAGIGLSGARHHANGAAGQANADRPPGAIGDADYHEPPEPEPVAPTIAISPDFGPTIGGTAIMIFGIGFVQGATVTFGTAPASDVIVVDSMSIRAITPPGEAGWVDVVVTNPTGQSFALPGGFSYAAEPSPGVPATITITSAGVSPKVIQVEAGSRVTFVNNDSRNHEIRSDPHPAHFDCQQLNEVGFVPPGANMQTGLFLSSRVCGFHDHIESTNPALVGRIVIK